MLWKRFKTLGFGTKDLKVVEGTNIQQKRKKSGSAKGSGFFRFDIQLSMSKRHKISSKI